MNRTIDMDSAWTPAWHQRFGPARLARARVRTAFFNLLRAIARTDDARGIASTAFDHLNARRFELPAAALRHDIPYLDLGRAGEGDAAARRRPVFITARFRSGSTLLWNLFRHLDGCTAYYEPLNERRWFDPAHRGDRIDRTHRNVDDYWREYDGLEELDRHYQEDWIRRRLYMDEASWDPDLAAYVRTLVERAPGRPVLQFNRIDFRLAWFRHIFPAATIVHLYRHPRDQWCSSLGNGSKCPPTARMAEFAANDGFYLLTWANDLKHRFPFLDPSTIGHPYRLFYLIWKLSFWFGVSYAHHSLSFESLVASPATELRRLFRAIGADGTDVDPLCALVEPTPSRWPKYASDDWFRGHESACEDILHDFFGPSAIDGADCMSLHEAVAVEGRRRRVHSSGRVGS